MKKNTRLTFKEFEKYCTENPPQKIIFDSREQPRDLTDLTLRGTLEFTVIKFIHYPDHIILALDEKDSRGLYINQISFNRIKHIIFREEITDAKTFIIVCDTWLDDADTIKYKIVLT